MDINEAQANSQNNTNENPDVITLNHSTVLVFSFKLNLHLF